jgi:hypothetical protein
MWLSENIDGITVAMGYMVKGYMLLLPKVG